MVDSSLETVETVQGGIFQEGLRALKQLIKLLKKKKKGKEKGRCLVKFVTSP